MHDSGTSFQIEWSLDGCEIRFLKAPKHFATVHYEKDDKKARIACTCRADAKWSCGSPDIEQKIQQTFESHLVYANRPATVIL